MWSLSGVAQQGLNERCMMKDARTRPIAGTIVAHAVGGGKSADDVKRYYELLVRDIANIEAGKVPFPAYRPPCPGPNVGYEADRLKHLKI
uniref:Uncharacterized protein n=1 Tax=Aegilops tauschii TaxID=37682 RepID=M8BR56_AEGTA